MNKKNLAKFKLEILFQNFLSCFPGMTDSEDVIDMLRDFFYAGAGEIMILQLYPPKGMTNEKISDVLVEMYSEIVAYSKAKEAEFYAENN